MNESKHIELDSLGIHFATLDYSLLPEHIRGAMKEYLVYGRLPGGFCLAVLENNLVQSFARADHINTYAMHDIVRWLYMECPASAWGDKDTVINFSTDRNLRLAKENECNDDNVCIDTTTTTKSKFL